MHFTQVVRLHRLDAFCRSPPTQTGFWDESSSRGRWGEDAPQNAGGDCHPRPAKFGGAGAREPVFYLLFGSAGRGLFGGGPGQGGYLEPEGIVTDFVVSVDVDDLGVL